jgi:hypothetical protein
MISHKLGGDNLGFPSHKMWRMRSLIDPVIFDQFPEMAVQRKWIILPWNGPDSQSAMFQVSQWRRFLLRDLVMSNLSHAMENQQQKNPQKVCGCVSPKRKPHELLKKTMYLIDLVMFVPSHAMASRSQMNHRKWIGLVGQVRRSLETLKMRMFLIDPVTFGRFPVMANQEQRNPLKWTGHVALVRKHLTTWKMRMFLTDQVMFVPFPVMANQPQRNPQKWIGHVALVRRSLETWTMRMFLIDLAMFAQFHVMDILMMQPTQVLNGAGNQVTRFRVFLMKMFLLIAPEGEKLHPELCSPRTPFLRFC